MNDTWEWTGRRWVQLFPEHSPSKRAGFAMVYDSNRQQVVLFGGADGTTRYNDTWIYKNGDWTKLDTPNAPSERAYSAAAFNNVLDKVILFGGGTATTNYFDTWQFDGTTWTRLQEDGPHLTSPEMAYDASRDQLILVGINSETKAEMYLWTGTTWQKQTPSVMPNCVQNGQLVYQTQTQKIIQIGGRCSGAFDGVFEWDGSNWIKTSFTGTPGIAELVAAAYDEVRHEVILFGGIDFAERSLTYGYRDGNWSARGDLVEPGPRSLLVFEAFPSMNETLLFGGQNERIEYNDLWQYANGRWLFSAAPDRPATCGSPVGALDANRGRLVVLCQDSSTFEFDGTKWYSFSNLKDKPAARRFSAMVYDEQNKNVLLFGGYDGSNYLRDAWTWNGTVWTHLDRKNSPPARMLPELFYDPNSKKVILFGGIGRPTRDDRITRYEDQWSFDGHAWTEQTVTKPPTRYGAQTEFDPRLNKVVMFGGKNAQEQYLAETWTWDGTAWAQLQPATSPDPRMNGGLAFDPSTQQLLYYGGYAAGYYSELWSFDGTTWKIVPSPTGRTRGTQRPGTTSTATPSMLRLPIR